MAASDFNYADYLLYTGATDINSALYATAAHSVIGILENQFYIYTEAQTIVKNLFIDSTTFELPATPITTITSISFDGTDLDTDTYSWYGEDVELTTAVTDTRIPLVLTLEVGYTILPSDLKLAIYRHIDSIIFAIENNTDSIDKVTNSTGNTTYYKDSQIPASILSVYEYYTARTQVLS